MSYRVKCRDGQCEYKTLSDLEKMKENCNDDLVCLTEVDIIKKQLE